MRWTNQHSVQHILALVVAAGSACDGGEPGDVKPSAAPVDVVVSAPIQGPSVNAYPASIASTEQAKVATRASGEVRRVLADVGTDVRKGQRLVQLDAAGVTADIEGAQAQLRRARKRHERMEALARDGAATQQELDDARAALETAEAKLRGARAQQDYVVLRAPFDGVITARMVDVGDLASPGQPLMTLMRRGSLEIVADLPAQRGASVTPGGEAVVFVPDTGRRYRARVTRTSGALDQQSRRIRIEARFVDREPAEASEQSLLPGSFVRLELSGPAKPTLWLPEDAIVRHGQLTGVYVVRDDELRLRWVRLGMTREGAVEILSGVTPKVAVVRRPPVTFTDSQPVAQVKREQWALEDAATPEEASR